MLCLVYINEIFCLHTSFQNQSKLQIVCLFPREKQPVLITTQFISEQRLPKFYQFAENAGLRVHLPTDAFFRGVSHPHAPRRDGPGFGGL